MSEIKINLSNKFDTLMDDDSGEFSNSTQKVQTKKTVKLPPIVITGQSTKSVIEFLKANNVKKFFVKTQSIGNKVFLDDKSEYDHLINKLNEKSNLYFTHDNPNTRPLKIILSGLPKMDTAELLEIFNEDEIVIPNDIKTITVSRPRYDNEVIYLLYYTKGATSLNDLRKHKSISNIIVKWNIHNNYRSSPTQCRRCQMFGHGTRNCHMTLKCMFCSCDHASDNCPTSKLREDERDSAIKCANCGMGHPSNSKICPKRQEYERIMETIQQKNNLNRNKHQKSKTQVDPTKRLVLNENNFPHMRSNSNQFWFTQFNEGASQQSRIPTTQTAQSPNRDELFTYSEITSLVKEVINKLGPCKTRAEQAEVIMNITIKYVYGSGNK